MKRAVLLLMALLLPASMVMAGEVYGTITRGDKPVAAGVKVEVAIAGKQYTTETDQFGSYRVPLKEKGKGTITVRLTDGAASAGFFSYDKATRYDWILQSTDGDLSLRRK